MRKWAIRDTFGEQEMIENLWLYSTGPGTGPGSGIACFIHWVLGDEMEWVPSFTGNANLLQRIPPMVERTIEVAPGWTHTYKTRAW